MLNPHSTPVANCTVIPKMAYIPWRVVLAHAEPYLAHNIFALRQFHQAIADASDVIDFGERTVTVLLAKITLTTSSYNLELALGHIVSALGKELLYLDPDSPEALKILGLKEVVDGIRKDFLQEP